MKQIQAVILGFGDRSACYANYATIYPNELKIIAVIDILEFKLKIAKEKFNLDDSMLFSSLEEFLKRDIKCDVVINGTMDNQHYKTSTALLKKGYNILLEKPITNNKKELFDIRDLANKNNCKVIVCHVLRYTPFYRKVKEILDSNEIGKIVDMQFNEHVWIGHFVNAFVRGKWNNEKRCGSGLLLQKCCHDADLICWLNNKTYPKEVSSFGSKSTFCQSNAPKNSTEYCYNCPVKDDCMYNAYTFELVMDAIPFYIWQDINKPLDKITEEEKIEYLKTNRYGKCVYKTDMDIVDRQCVSISFENGSIATLNMVGATSKAGRSLHIICEYGEIMGHIEENKIIYRKFNKEATKVKYRDDLDFYTDIIIDLNKENTSGNSVTGHYGGDYYLMQDLIKFLNNEKTSSSTTTINDSVNSHLVCYASEVARKKHKVAKI